MKVLRCRDAGADCNFEARAESTEEILHLAVEHGRRDHGMEEIPEGMAEKLEALIRDE